MPDSRPIQMRFMAEKVVMKQVFSILFEVFLFQYPSTNTPHRHRHLFDLQSTVRLIGVATDGVIRSNKWKTLTSL